MEQTNEPLVQIQIGENGFNSHVVIDGKVVPATRVQITTEVDKPTFVEMTILKMPGIGVGGKNGDQVLEGYLVDHQEYEKYQAWKRAQPWGS